MFYHNIGYNTTIAPANHPFFAVNHTLSQTLWLMAKSCNGARSMKGSPLGSAQIAIDFSAVLNYNTIIHGAAAPLLIQMQRRLAAVSQCKGG